MAKPEKFGHRHLVYHFAVPLKNFKYLDLSNIFEEYKILPDLGEIMKCFFISRNICTLQISEDNIKTNFGDLGHSLPALILYICYWHLTADILVIR